MINLQTISELLCFLSCATPARVARPNWQATSLRTKSVIPPVMCISPFPMRGGKVGALEGGTGFSLGSIPLTCFNLSNFTCSIHLVPVIFLLACKPSAVVAVEMVESMIGVSSMTLRSPTLPPLVRVSSIPLLE